jgi:hypothetical protein
MCQRARARQLRRGASASRRGHTRASRHDDELLPARQHRLRLRLRLAECDELVAQRRPQLLGLPRVRDLCLAIAYGRLPERDRLRALGGGELGGEARRDGRLRRARRGLLALGLLPRLLEREQLLLAS